MSHQVYNYTILTIFFYIISYHIELNYIILYYIILCYVMLCYIMLYYIILYYYNIVYYKMSLAILAVGLPGEPQGTPTTTPWRRCSTETRTPCGSTRTRWRATSAAQVPRAERDLWFIWGFMMIYMGFHDDLSWWFIWISWSFIWGFMMIYMDFIEIYMDFMGNLYGVSWWFIWISWGIYMGFHDDLYGFHGESIWGFMMIYMDFMGNLYGVSWWFIWISWWFI